MKVLAGFISILLIPLIFTSILGFTLEQTLLKPEFLKQHAEKTNFYPELAKAVPAFLASAPDGENIDPELANQAISTILTPGVLQQKIDGTLQQFSAYLKNEGDSPEIDLRDIAQQLQAQGIEVPQEVVSEPLKLPASESLQLKENFARSQQVKWGALIGGLVLFLVLFLIAVKEHHYWPLVFVFFASAVGQAFLFFAVRVAPNFALDQLKADTAGMEQFTRAVRAMVESVINDVSNRFGIWAALFVALTLVTFIMAIVSYFRHRGDPKPQPRAAVAKPAKA